MHICVLAFDHNPYDGRIYHREAKSFAKRGHRVTILSLCEGSPQHPAQSSVEVLWLTVKRRNVYFRFLLKLWVMFREARAQRADIYHCHEPESHLVGLALKCITPAKLVLDVHESYADLIPLAGRFYKYVYVFTCFVVEPLLCWADDLIICADNEIACHYRKFNRNVITVFNYPQAELWAARPRPDRSHVAILIYAGLVSEVNGAWEMVAIAKTLAGKGRRVKLLVLGSGSKYLRHELKDYVRANGLTEVVELRAEIPQPEVAEHLQRADIGLLLYHPIPKYQKNIPTKQFEYSLSGLPIVASNLVPIRDFVEARKCGVLVTPASVPEAVAAVEYLLDNRDEADAMAARGRAAIDTELNWLVMEGVLFEGYDRLAQALSSKRSSRVA